MAKANSKLKDRKIRFDGIFANPCQAGPVIPNRGQRRKTPLDRFTDAYKRDAQDCSECGAAFTGDDSKRVIFSPNRIPYALCAQCHAIFSKHGARYLPNIWRDDRIAAIFRIQKKSPSVDALGLNYQVANSVQKVN